MPFEDDLGAALRGTGDSFSADNRSLVAAGLARGRTLRRRRAAVTGAVVAVAAAGVAAALVVPGDVSRHAVPAMNAPAKAPAKGPENTPATGSRRPEVSDQEMLTLFKALLPGGSVSDERGRGTRSIGRRDPAPYAALVFDDGRGASTLSVDLSLVTGGQQQDQCPDLAFVKKGTKCTRTQLPDGSVLLVVQGWEYQDERKGPRNWRAVLTTPEGRQIGVSEWNAAAEKGAPQTRSEPPLTPAQLGAIVRSSSWDKVFDAIPAKDHGTAPASPADTAPDVGRIVEVLKAALPAKLHTSASGGGSGYAHLTVDDGKGATFVEVNVESWGAKGVQDDLFAGAVVLADGTRMIVRQGDAEKGGDGTVQWTVDTIRPGGLRVAVSELNADGYHRPATRPSPVLDIATLRSVATDAGWKALG